MKKMVNKLIIAGIFSIFSVAAMAQDGKCPEGQSFEDTGTDQEWPLDSVINEQAYESQMEQSDTEAIEPDKSLAPGQQSQEYYRQFQGEAHVNLDEMQADTAAAINEPEIPQDTTTEASQRSIMIDEDRYFIDSEYQLESEIQDTIQYNEYDSEQGHEADKNYIDSSYFIPGNRG